MRELGLDTEGDDIPWEQVSSRLAAMRQRGMDWLSLSIDRALDGPTATITRAAK